MRWFLPFLLILLPHPVVAQEDAATSAGPVTFQLPIRCTPDTDCWVMNYIDHTPEGDNKAVDGACGPRTYDGHKGIDIMIPNERVMKSGVDVLAARDGTVLRMRNGEDDRFPTDEQLAKAKADKKECGNAVLIDHGNDWQTLYCHMRKDSIVVKIGDHVKAGDKIGMVGLSGFTQFPHVHFGITHNGQTMDPFTGTDVGADCHQAGTSLWEASTKLTYQDISFYDAAFDNAPATLDDLDHGRATLKTLSAKEAGALVFHTVIGGIRAGDMIDLSILGPDGIFARRQTMQDKTRARQMLFIGRRTDQIQLKPGTYKGIVRVQRGEKTWQRVTTIDVTP